MKYEAVFCENIEKIKFNGSCIEDYIYKNDFGDETTPTNISDERSSPKHPKGLCFAQGVFVSPERALKGDVTMYPQFQMMTLYNSLKNADQSFFF